MHLLLWGPTAQICRNNRQVGNLCCLGPLFSCRSHSSHSFSLCSPLKQFSAQLRDGTCSVSEDTPQWAFASKERATWNQTRRIQPQTRSQLHSHHTERALQRRYRSRQQKIWMQMRGAVSQPAAWQGITIHSTLFQCFLASLQRREIRGQDSTYYM